MKIKDKNKDLWIYCCIIEGNSLFSAEEKDEK